MKIAAIDTETTGSDFWHGCLPFMVQACDGDFNYAWIGEVNPYNRAEVTWKDSDIKEIQQFVNSLDLIIFHHAKFDVRALEKIGVKVPWSKVVCSLLASHLACSGEPHGLKYLAFKYLDYYNENEKLLAKAVQKARTENPKYDIAKPNHPTMPGAGSDKKTQWYKMDYWLCIDECLKYGMDDVEMTYMIWHMYYDYMEKEKLLDVYEVRRKQLQITYEMEDAGLYLYSDEVRETIESLEAENREIREFIQTSYGIKHYVDLDRDSDIKFLLFHVFDVEPCSLYVTKKRGEPSISKDALQAYIDAEPEHEGLQKFAKYRENTASKNQYNSYLKYLCDDNRIHSNFWITGTRETRFATTNPNVQNLNKRLRHVFGPPPGYVWLDYDLVNIELRIWTYAVGNEELLQVFESGGSVHLLIASVIHPELWNEFSGDAFKKEFEETWYQWVKNGNFAIIYGATRRKADLTYKKPGCYDLIAHRFPEVPAYTQKCIAEAERNYDLNYAAYVETLGGYRLDVPLDDVFKACNYKIQGSAGYFINEALINVHENGWYREWGCRMVNTVHDSIIIEVPEDHPKELQLAFKESIEDAGRKYLPTCEASYKVVECREVPF